MQRIWEAKTEDLFLFQNKQNFKKSDFNISGASCRKVTGKEIRHCICLYIHNIHMIIFPYNLKKI